jgi:hypothetical protein
MAFKAAIIVRIVLINKMLKHIDQNTVYLFGCIARVLG